jgi:CDP-glucose 4,6-dehydratase
MFWKNYGRREMLLGKFGINKVTQKVFIKMEDTKFNLFKDKKIIITGHTGFKGAWLTVWLNMLGADLYGISDGIPTEPSMFDDLSLKKKIKHILLDVRDNTSIKKEFERIEPDFVFHLAAQPIVSTSYSDPLDTISTNTMGTAVVLNALRFLKNKCVGIFITSDKCYENVEWEWGYKETDQLGGKDVYSGSKAAAEIIFRSFYHSYLAALSNIRVATGRAGNVIGGGDWAKDRIVPDCIRSWSLDQKVTLRKPHATRPWQHVLEPLSGYLNLACELWYSERFDGQSFNFGPFPENNVTVLKLLKKLSKSFGISDPNKAYDYVERSSFKEAGLLMLNCEKSLFHLGWKPSLDLKQLIHFTGDWYLQNYKGEIDMFDYTRSQIENFIETAADKQIEWATPELAMN